MGDYPKLKSEQSTVTLAGNDGPLLFDVCKSGEFPTVAVVDVHKENVGPKGGTQHDVLVHCPEDRRRMDKVSGFGTPETAPRADKKPGFALSFKP